MTGETDIDAPEPLSTPEVHLVGAVLTGTPLEVQALAAATSLDAEQVRTLMSDLSLT